MKPPVMVFGACVWIFAMFGDSWAQVYDGFDSGPYLEAPNGLRIYFDETVDAGYGGENTDPEYYAVSTGPLVEVYLVLTNPSSEGISGWQCEFLLGGQGTVSPPVFFGDSIINNSEVDIYDVTFPTPLPLGDLHFPLVRFDLVLEEGTNPHGFDFGFMAFFIRPITGNELGLPGYFNEDNEFVPSDSIISVSRGWHQPCMLLNSRIGISAEESVSWGKLKSLFR